MLAHKEVAWSQSIHHPAIQKPKGKEHGPLAALGCREQPSESTTENRIDRHVSKCLSAETNRYRCIKSKQLFQISDEVNPADQGFCLMIAARENCKGKWIIADALLKKRPLGEQKADAALPVASAAASHWCRLLPPAAAAGTAGSLPVGYGYR